MYRVIEPTEIELITVEEFKQFVRVDVDETEDDVLMGMILESTIEFCESYTSRSIALKTYEKVFKRLCSLASLEVRKGDITEIVSLIKKDSTGDEESSEVSEFEFFNYGQHSDVSLINQTDHIEIGTNLTRPLVLVFKSGYIDTTLPKNLRNAILMLASHWYENRETIKIEEMTDVTEMPYGVTAVLERYKYRRL
jgi:uncharacterized phiE125 gp8 family phage protein